MARKAVVLTVARRCHCIRGFVLRARVLVAKLSMALHTRRSVSVLAVLAPCYALFSVAAVLSVSAAQAEAKAPCRPGVGETVAQLVQRCGKPDEVFTTRSITGWRHEEWRYGGVYVGLIDGRVNYVLK